MKGFGGKKYMGKLVTIGIPLYNMESTIGKAIDSCLSQTYKNIEILVVDDGSTDNSANIVKKYNDKRIRYIAKKHNSGVCDTMNVIVENAKGKYVAFLDADDEMLNTRIEKQYKAIRRAKIFHSKKMVASFCGSKMVDLKTNTISYINPNKLFKGEFGGGTGHSMYKVRDIKELGGFDTRFSRSADSALCLKFLVRGGHYAMVKEPLLIYNFIWTKDKEEYSQKEMQVFNDLVEEIVKPKDFSRKYLKNLNSHWKEIRENMKKDAKSGKLSFLNNYVKLVQIKRKLYLYLLLYCSVRYILEKRRLDEIEFREKFKLEPHTYLIDKLLKGCKYKKYLELGVFDGVAFNYINKNNKLKLAKCVDMNRMHTISDKYFCNMTTDEFFLKNDKRFDLIFIDADHRFEQVVKDFQNSLNILEKGGTIILHDTDPSSKELFADVYCSNSYKMNQYLDEKNDFQYITLPIGNCGLTIVRRKEDMRHLEWLNMG